jgi:hypothetical protein
MYLSTQQVKGRTITTASPTPFELPDKVCMCGPPARRLMRPESQPWHFPMGDPSWRHMPGADLRKHTGPSNPPRILRLFQALNLVKACDGAPAVPSLESTNLVVGVAPLQAPSLVEHEAINLGIYHGVRLRLWPARSARRQARARK